MYDPKHVIELKEVEWEPDLEYEERPEAIFYLKVQELRTKTIPLAKVLWRYNGVEEASWEINGKMRSILLELFEQV